MSALGGLLGAMGGDAPPDAGGGDPEALLGQIVDLMNQYLALGPETPAYQTVSEALPAIQESMGGGGMPPEVGMEGMPPEGGGDVPQENDASADPMSMMPSSPPSGFADASAMALEDMKKRKPKGY